MKRVSGIIALVGLLLTIIGFREGIAGLKEPIDIYEMENNISDVGYFDMVKVDVFAVYGTYLTRTTTENGRKTNQDSYYMIPAHEGDEYRYVGIKVNEKEYAIFDEIYKDTYDDGANYEKDYGVVKIGCLKKMSPKMQDYYYDALREAEWFDSEEEMKTYALPYYIDPVKSQKTMVPFLFIGVILFLAGGIVFLLSWRFENQAYRKAMGQTYVTIAGVQYPKSQLAHVNMCIRSQEKIFAVRELAKITGLSEEEAAQIIERWNEYYF